MNHKSIPALFLLLTSSLMAGPYFYDYHNPELENISFDDSIMIASYYYFHEIPKGWKGAGEEGEIITHDSTEIVPFELRLDTVDRKISFIGKGRPYDFYLDNQNRVTKIVLDNIRTTTISYGENEKIIQDFPNDFVMSRHVKEWHYQYREDGQLQRLVRTPTDWDNGTIFWARDHADTVEFSFDSEGRVTGCAHIQYSTDFAHTVPWKRVKDSLEYRYDTVNGKKTVTIESLSPFSGEWITMSGDTQWVATYNDKDQIEFETKKRWDNGGWDSTYCWETTFTYDGDRIKRRLEYLYYGNNKSKSIVDSDEQYFYADNTLHGKGLTPIAERSINFSGIGRAYFFQNSNQQVSIGGDAGMNYDQIAIYSLAGRMIRSVSDARSISVEGLAMGQPLLFVAHRNGQRFSSKLFLK